MKKLIGRFKPPTEDELLEMDKWVPWTDVIDVCKKLKSEYHSAEKGSKERALALMKYLVGGRVYPSAIDHSCLFR